MSAWCREFVAGLPKTVSGEMRLARIGLFRACE
jgi:hypothetical protein